jgi:hypothetical protein
MRAIGFRCGKAELTYVILDGTRVNPSLQHKEKVASPAGLVRADVLVWLRKEIHSILDRFGPDAGAYKRTEPIALPSPDRLEVEGVIQEACRSHDSKLSLRGLVIKQISLELLHQGPARSVNSSLDARGLGEVNNSKYADCALAALCSLKQ